MPPADTIHPVPSLDQAIERLYDQDTPDNPFLYLRKDGFWSATHADTGQPLDRQPLIRESGQVFARFTGGFEFLVAIPENRRRMREALVSRYFPQHAARMLGALPASEPASLKVAEESPEYGRSPAFRRKILQIYDHQCAACGLRIVLLPKDPAFHPDGDGLAWRCGRWSA